MRVIIIAIILSVLFICFFMLCACSVAGLADEGAEKIINSEVLKRNNKIDRLGKKEKTDEKIIYPKRSSHTAWN